MKVYPRRQLSIAGNLDEFKIPDTNLGKEICKLHIVWGWVDGVMQPCIWMEGVNYPNFRPATKQEWQSKQ